MPFEICGWIGKNPTSFPGLFHRQGKSPGNEVGKKRNFFFLHNRLQREQLICLIECIAEFRSFYKFEGKSSTKAKILILSPGKQRTSLANDLFNFAIFLERLGGSARIIQHWFIASLNPGISVTHDECVTENKLKMLATCPSKKICVFGSSRLDDVQTTSCGIYEHL